MKTLILIVFLCALHHAYCADYYTMQITIDSAFKEFNPLIEYKPILDLAILLNKEDIQYKFCENSEAESLRDYIAKRKDTSVMIGIPSAISSYYPKIPPLASPATKKKQP